MDFSARLKSVIKRSQLNRDAFAEKTGVSRRHLFNYLGETSTPTADFFQAVKDAFPWVNIEWMVTGIGSMDAPVTGEEAGEYRRRPPPIDDIGEKILLMLNEMSEEKRREVLRHVEEKKLLADLLAEKRQRKNNG